MKTSSSTEDREILTLVFLLAFLGSCLGTAMVILWVSFEFPTILTDQEGYRYSSLVSENVMTRVLSLFFASGFIVIPVITIILLSRVFSYRLNKVPGFKKDPALPRPRGGETKQGARTFIGGGRRKNQKPLARLLILVARRELIDMEVDIQGNTTRLGRNPKLCDIQLMNEDDISTVSGLHCTIQYDTKKNTFMITDDNSANGTYVNGSLLAANEPHILQDGDEIVMGELIRRGVKVRFSIVTKGNNCTYQLENQLSGSDLIHYDDILSLPPKPEDVDDSWLNDL